MDPEAESVLLMLGNGTQSCRLPELPERPKGKTEARWGPRPDGTYYKNSSKADKGEYKPNSPTPQSFQAFSFNVEAKSGNVEWLVDSGCNKHMSYYVHTGNKMNMMIVCSMQRIILVMKLHDCGYTWMIVV